MNLAQGRGEVVKLLMDVAQADGTQLKTVMCHLIGMLADRGVLSSADVALLLVRSGDPNKSDNYPMGIVVSQHFVPPEPMQQTWHESPVVNDAPRQVIPLMPSAHTLLSPRQYDVLLELAKGSPQKTIARRLNVSVPTVKSHLACIYEKLKANNARQAVASALQRGIITTEEIA